MVHGPICVMSTGPDTYCLDLPTSMAAVHPWFHVSFLKPAGPQPAGPSALEDDSYEVEAIFQINKRGTRTKVKWMGYDSSHNQWIQLYELRDTALEVMKTFLRGKERERDSLRPRKRT